MNAVYLDSKAHSFWHFLNKYNVFRYSLIFILFCWVSPALLHAQKRIPYEFKQFTISDGLLDNTVYGCFQDSEKYMWFFTPSGTSRFNGRVFENFTINENLADNEVLNAYEDSQKRIWFYSFNGRLAYFNIKTNKVESYRERSFLKSSRNDPVIKSIIEDANKNIWIYYDSDFIDVLYNNKLNTIKQLGTLINAHKFTTGSISLFKTSKKPEYVHQLGYNFLSSININTFKVENYKELPFNKRLFVSNDNDIYFGSSRGIDSWDGNSIKTIIDASLYSGKTLKSLSLTNNIIWLGLNDGAIAYDLTDRKVKHFFHTGIPVTRVFCDHEENYWITTFGKGVLLLPKDFQGVSIRNKFYGIGENEVTSLDYHQETGNLLFSVTPNLIYSLSPDKKLSSTRIDSVEYLKINKIKTRGNDLWMITQNNYIYFYQDILKHLPAKLKLSKKFDQISPVTSYDINDLNQLIASLTVVKGINRLPDDYIYVTYHSIIKVAFKNNKFQAYFNAGPKLNAALGRIYALTKDKSGRIWFGGSLGIGNNSPLNDTVYNYIPSLNFESTINDMCAVGENTVIVSTSGAGIYIIKNEKIVAHILENQGLSSNNCNKIFKQDDSKVWVATTKGACLLNFKDTSYLNPEITIYGGKNTHPATYINDLLVINDTLHLATNDGLYSFDINRVTPQYKKPILKILSPQPFIDKPNEVFHLDYNMFNNTNQINFLFESIAFLNGENITYQYQLFRNDELIQSDTITQKDKFNLPFSSLITGNYRLQISCKRGDNIQSDPIITEFIVNPPIWKSVGAIVLYVLLSGWVFFKILGKLSRNKRRREKLQLEQQAEKNRLETMALEARQQLLALEQESLRARIDPHFIFNCLNGLMSFVYEKDYQSIKALLPKLSKIIRSSLQLARKDFISIEEERGYLDDYLILEKMRFENLFIYSIVIDNDVDILKPIIPPLMLQIFVENAIKHGFKNMPKGKQGTIDIHFTLKNNTIICQVKDNGMGISNSLAHKSNKEHISLGIETVKKRIDILNEIHQLHYKITFDEWSHDSQSGTIVTLTIPFNKN